MLTREIINQKKTKLDVVKVEYQPWFDRFLVKIRTEAGEGYVKLDQSDLPMNVYSVTMWSINDVADMALNRAEDGNWFTDPKWDKDFIGQIRSMLEIIRESKFAVAFLTLFCGLTVGICYLMLIQWLLNR